MTTEQLVEGLKNNERKAVEYLVSTFQDSVIKTAYYFTGNIEDAQDLSQEVMLEVLRSVGSYHNKGTLRSWIYRITVNRSLDHIRMTKRRNIFHRLESLLHISSNGEKHFHGEMMVADHPGDTEEKKKNDRECYRFPSCQPKNCVHFVQV